LYLDQMYNFLY